MRGCLFFFFIKTVSNKNSGALATQTATVQSVLLPWSGVSRTKASGSMFITPLNRRKPTENATNMVMSKAFRIVLNGLHKRISIKKPINVIANTDIVDISTTGILKFLYKMKITVRAAKLVSPAGKAF